MIVIRDPAAVNSIADLDIRALVNLRFAQLCDGSDDPYDTDILGYFIIVQPGDTVDMLESECGCPILHNYLEPEIRFGNPDFVHSAEVLEDHSYCYEMVFILGGDFGISLFIPKTEGINPELLAMCGQYAVPAPDLAEA